MNCVTWTGYGVRLFYHHILFYSEEEQPARSAYINHLYFHVLRMNFIYHLLLSSQRRCCWWYGVVTAHIIIKESKLYDLDVVSGIDFVIGSIADADSSLLWQKNIWHHSFWGTKPMPLYSSKTTVKEGILVIYIFYCSVDVVHGMHAYTVHANTYSR